MTPNTSNGLFENISPERIIALAETYSTFPEEVLRPEELLKTKYTYGQTIILRGKKEDYAQLIDFWLAAQFWYDDGCDTLFEELVFNNFTTIPGWQKMEHLIGICKSVSHEEKLGIDRNISALLGWAVDNQYLIMNPRWDEKKALFVDDQFYYLYYFWTGE